MQYYFQWGVWKQVSVSTDPELVFNADSLTISEGQSTTLTWFTVNVDSVTASGSWSGSKALSGSESTGNLIQTSTYTLTATGNGKTVTKNITITVEVVVPELSLTFSANKTNVTPGETVVLTWESQNANAVSASGAWSGSKALSGTFTTSALNASSTFILTASDTNNQEVIKQVRITVGTGPQPFNGRALVGYWETWDATIHPPVGHIALNDISNRFNVICIAFPSFLVMELVFWKMMQHPAKILRNPRK